MKPTTLTRQELYNEVWATSIHQLCKKYSLSDVGLAKICKKHDIPRPPVGYWARKAHGKKVRQVRLPRKRPPDEVVTIHHQPGSSSRQPNQTELVLDTDLADAHSQEEATERIVVPDQLAEPHRLLSKAVREFRRGKGLKRGSNRPDPRVAYGDFGIHVTPESAERAIRIVDTLLKALDARGHKTRKHDGNYQITLLGETIRFRIEEMCKQTLRKDGDNVLMKTRWDFEPSGRLRLSLWSVEPNACDRHWRDGRVQRIETILNKLILAAIQGVQLQRQARIEDENRRIAAERHVQELREAEIRRIKEAEARRREKEWVEGLFKQVENWQRAEGIREYLDEIRSVVAKRDLMIQPNSELAEWMAHAASVADELNPLMSIRG